MSDAGCVDVAVEFVRRLNAGEVPGANDLRLEIDEVVVDGCVVALFGSARSEVDRAFPVACRVLVEGGVVSDWSLYGSAAANPRLRSRTRTAQPETGGT